MSYTPVSEETPERRARRLATQKAYRDRNREKQTLKQQEYYAREREAILERARIKRETPEAREQAKTKAKEYRARINAIIIAAKETPCVDCGIELPPQVMEFDHVRGEKLFTISHWHRFRIKGTGKTREQLIKEEIAKCEIRCPNCHDLRHFNEKSGNYASGK